jgi:hypothetical protein
MLAQHLKVQPLYLVACPRRLAQEAQTRPDTRITGEAPYFHATAHRFPAKLVDQLIQHALERYTVERISRPVVRIRHRSLRYTWQI